MQKYRIIFIITSFTSFFLYSCTKDNNHLKEALDVLPNDDNIRIDSYLEDQFFTFTDNDLISSNSKESFNKGTLLLDNLTPNKKKFTKYSFKYSRAKIDAPFFIKPYIDNYIIYLHDVSGKIIAYNYKDKTILWEKKLFTDKENINFLAGGLVVVDDKLYVTNGSNFLSVLNIASGEIIWQNDLGFISRSTPLIDGNMVIISRIDNYLISFNKDSGKRLWGIKYNSNLAKIYGASSLFVKGNFLLSGNENGEIQVFDKLTGNLLWKNNIAAANISSSYNFSDVLSLPLSHNNYIFTISNNGFLVASDIFSGLKLWEVKLSSYQNMWFTENLIFLIDNNHKLISLSPANGAVKWVHNLQDLVASKEVYFYGPQIINNMISVISSNGWFYLFNYNDGSLIKKIKFPKNIHQFPIIADNKLFFVNNKSKLFILD